jgi:hypothetical protein
MDRVDSETCCLFIDRLSLHMSGALCTLAAVHMLHGGSPSPIIQEVPLAISSDAKRIMIFIII